jgi:hypothetical protein
MLALIKLKHCWKLLYLIYFLLELISKIPGLEKTRRRIIFKFLHALFSDTTGFVMEKGLCFGVKISLNLNETLKEPTTMECPISKGLLAIIKKMVTETL